MNAEQQVQYLCPIFAYCKVILLTGVTSNALITLHPVQTLLSLCMCPDLYMNLNLGALVFQGCCHTRQKWNLWVCGFVSVCCVCISKHVPIRVFSYPHLCRRHLLTHASFFVLQFSLIFFLCGRHVQFHVVRHTHIFVIMLGLKVICTHFHIQTRAGRHVLNLICARIVLCHCIHPCMRRHKCPVLHCHRCIDCQYLWLKNKLFF